MFRKLNTRISPASPIAMIALFVALSGVSYAAGTIGTAELKNGAVTKKKLRKNAVATPKIVNGAVSGPKVQDGAIGTAKLADGAVTGAKVEESSLGVVPDAAKLGGKDPSAYESKGFGGSGDTNTVTLPTSSTTEVQAVALPAGTYMVLARGGLNNNGGAPASSGQLCTVTAGSNSQTINFGALGANGTSGDRQEFGMNIVATLDAPGQATLSCKTNAGWASGNVTDPSIAAISLQP